MIEFSKLQTVDAMQSVDDMVCLNYNSTMQEKLGIIKTHLFTRYPVYKDSPNNIVGVIHTKDMLSKLADGDNQQEVLRPILKVYYHDQLIDILRKFQLGKPHFALVYKKNDLIGFITLDNLLTILLGRMSDEFNLVKEPWLTLSANKFLIKGKAPVYAIEKLTEIDLSHFPADNVNDLLGQVLNNPFRVGDVWEQDEFSVEITKVKSKEVEEVILRLQAPTDE